MDKKTGRRYGRRLCIYTFLYPCNRVCNGGHCVARRPFLCMEYVFPTTTMCLLNIFPQNPLPFINISSLCTFPKPVASGRFPTPIFAYMEYVFPPTTLITYNFSPKPSPPIFPFGGDTPFCAFGYEIIDFYLTRKKTGRRYGLRF